MAIEDQGAQSGIGGGQSLGDGGAMDELVRATRELKDNLSRLFGASRGVASEKLHQVRDKGSDWLGRGRDRAHQVADGTSEYVREEPMKALLVAAGAGLLLGWLISRR